MTWSSAMRYTRLQWSVCVRLFVCLFCWYVRIYVCFLFCLFVVRTLWVFCFDFLNLRFKLEMSSPEAEIPAIVVLRYRCQCRVIPSLVPRRFLWSFCEIVTLLVVKFPSRIAKSYPVQNYSTVLILVGCKIFHVFFFSGFLSASA